MEWADGLLSKMLEWMGEWFDTPNPNHVFYLKRIVQLI